MPNDSRPANKHWTNHKQPTTTTSKPVARASINRGKTGGYAGWCFTSPAARRGTSTLAIPSHQARVATYPVQNLEA